MIRTLALWVLSAAAALAQIGTATITGRVIDSSGAVVADVAITVVNTGTNFQFAATTNADGLYRVQSLQPGPYRISFEAGASSGSFGMESSCAWVIPCPWMRLSRSAR